MQLGDLVRTRRLHGRWAHGVIVAVHRRPGPNYTGEGINDNPISEITVLKDNGKIAKWYASHSEVVQ